MHFYPLFILLTFCHFVTNKKIQAPPSQGLFGDLIARDLSEKQDKQNIETALLENIKIGMSDCQKKDSKLKVEGCIDNKRSEMSEIVFTGELNKFEGKENVNEKKLRIEAMNVCRDKDAGKTMQNCFRKFMINEAGKSKFSLKKQTSKKSKMQDKDCSETGRKGENCQDLLKNDD